MQISEGSTPTSHPLHSEFERSLQMSVIVGRNF